MENLHRQTKDDNFNIIIVDFESEDMDVEQALRESSVPRYVSVCVRQSALYIRTLNAFLEHFQVCVYVCFDRYEYLRREGNFERSAGLQIGVDTIEVRETHT